MKSTWLRDLPDLDPSLPSRERGLKFLEKGSLLNPYTVAPLAGAWIEMIYNTSAVTASYLSLPSRERGLKSKRLSLEEQGKFVAPLAGAWIEILRNHRRI